LNEETQVQSKVRITLIRLAHIIS